MSKKATQPNSAADAKKNTTRATPPPVPGPEKCEANKPTGEASKPPSPGQDTNKQPEKSESKKPTGEASDAPPPGLDAKEHEATQRIAHQAHVLKEGTFASMMATALGLDHCFNLAAYRLYLTNVIKDMGGTVDPIERMLIEQLCLAHFRTAQLHVGASGAKGIEAVKIYNAVAARMLGEMRRTGLALKAYRTGVPAGENGAKAKAKLYRAAQ